MSNLIPNSSFDDVYQLETTDRNMAGAGGVLNKPLQNLTNRTEFLKDNKLSDAPIDGNIYARKNGRWNIVPSGSISDSDLGRIKALEDDVEEVKGALNDTLDLASSAYSLAGAVNQTTQELQGKVENNTTNITNLATSMSGLQKEATAKWVLLNTVDTAARNNAKAIGTINSEMVKSVNDQLPDEKGNVTLTIDQSTAAFTIIYPNGGTEEAPANVSINTRYVMANPFLGEPVIVVAEILYDGIWGDAGTIYSSFTGSDGGYGTRAHHILETDAIIIQTGRRAVMYKLSTDAIGAHGSTTTGHLTTAPCRIKIWRIT